MSQPSRVRVHRCGDGFRYQHHAHTSHETYPDALAAARSAVAYANSMDWVYVEMQQASLAFLDREAYRILSEGRSDAP